MKCVLHRDRDAAHYCQICGQTICRECSDLLGAVCITCAERTCKEEKTEFWSTIAASVCAAAVGLWFAINSGANGAGIGTSIMMIVFFTCAPFGWRALNRITPNIFLFLPLAGWVIYFIIKFILAACIGWAVAIPKGISMYKKLKVVEDIERCIKIARGYPTQDMM